MPKIYVMMSGGVDSSVAALKMAKEYPGSVVGVYMKCWSRDQLDKMGVSQDLYACSWEDDLEDARVVANKLGIDFEVWDFQKEYLEKVVGYMIDEYKVGRTPNPDVMCNSVIKFGLFYQTATSKGADIVVSGHYARTKMADFMGQKFLSLARGLDENKDQSYFLWKIKARQLDSIKFPVGDFVSKASLRQTALDNNLITADKKDSQGLCFVGQTPLRELLLQTLGFKEGRILDQLSGKVLGKHPGAHTYTIGQREKLGLAGGPWFVSKIDIQKNVVYVTHLSQVAKSLDSSSLTASEANWFLPVEEGMEFTCQAQIRYRQKASSCRVKIVSKDQLFVSFDTPVRAIASGQSVVFYADDVLLGGGVID
jgi:tRNA-specific 2-thiouridylase